MEELRKHTRIDVSLDAVISDMDNTYITSGKSRSMSFGGVFAELDHPEKIEPDKQYICRLVLGFGGNHIPVEFTCRAAHVQEDGAGFQFIAVQEEGYPHFKRLILMNCENPELLQRELEKHPGLVFPQTA